MSNKRSFQIPLRPVYIYRTRDFFILVPDCSGVHSVRLADKHKKCISGARKALLALHKHKKHAFRVCRSDYQYANKAVCLEQTSSRWLISRIRNPLSK